MRDEYDFTDSQRGAIVKSNKERITIHRDPDMIDWFRGQVRGGGNDQTLINEALREHMERQSGADVESTLRRLRHLDDIARAEQRLAELTADESRNQMILEDVVQALGEGRSPILLTERRDHLAFFAERLEGTTNHLAVFQGGMKTKDRVAVIERLATIPEGEPRLVLATGKFVGEGFDDARLDTLFLAMPVSWKGTLVQYVGRRHRRHHAKQEVRVMDYVDRDVPMLAKMFEKRMRGYRAMGYSTDAQHP